MEIDEREGKQSEIRSLQMHSYPRTLCALLSLSKTRLKDPPLTLKDIWVSTINTVTHLEG